MRAKQVGSRRREGFQLALDDSPQPVAATPMILKWCWGTDGRGAEQQRSNFLASLIAGVVGTEMGEVGEVGEVLAQLISYACGHTSYLTRLDLIEAFGYQSVLCASIAAFQAQLYLLLYVP